MIAVSFAIFVINKRPQLLLPAVGCFGEFGKEIALYILIPTSNDIVVISGYYFDGSLVIWFDCNRFYVRLLGCAFCQQVS